MVHGKASSSVCTSANQTHLLLFCQCKILAAILILSKKLGRSIFSSTGSYPLDITLFFESKVIINFTYSSLPIVSKSFKTKVLV